MARTYALRAGLARVLHHPLTAPAAVILLTAATLWLAAGAGGYLVFILALAAINVIVGVGLNVLLGLSGQISFGHIGFYVIGAYAAGILMLAGLPYWGAFLAAGAIAAAVGGLLALPALRVSGPYLAMVTIAFAFIVEHGTIEWRDLTGGQNGLMGFPSPEAFGRMFFETEMALLATAIAGLSLLFYLRLRAGRWGLAMRAVSDSEVAARSIGLNPVAVKTAAFILSALLTGFAGALFTPLQGFISPSSFPFFQSILFLLAVVVGGTGTLFGPVVGVLVTVMLPEFLSSLAEYRLLFFGGLLLGVLLAAPRGVMGTLARLAATEDPTPARPSGRPLAEIIGGARATALEVTGLGIAFGGVQAAENVAFTAPPGKVTAIIGPNGAGKTTALNMIGGFYQPDAGSIRLGRELAGAPAHEVARAGIARTYQTTQLFDHLSVIDNVLIAMKKGRLGFLLGPRPGKADRQVAEDLLGVVGYRGPLAREARALPHVDRRLVEIARALATRPDVILLDEPAAGLSQADKESLAGLLTRLAEAGLVVILVEHDMDLVMGISDAVVVLDAGRPLMTGTPAEVQTSPAVRRAYLGEADFEGRPRPAPFERRREAVVATTRLSAGYGAAPVLEAVEVEVDPGEMVAVLGANGAGKSTMMRAVAGLHRPVEGTIVLADRDITALKAHAIAGAGLALVPEGRQVFPEMSVRDNILMGAYRRRDLKPGPEIDALLKRFPRLADRIDQRAGVLSGGEQQMLAVARGLIARPRILLLDEPSLGLAPAMVRELYDALADLRDEGVTILLVDQMATLALAIADRGYVLENGEVVTSGTTEALKGDPAIEAAYLGIAG
ncbi:branched-chain amino acid ABC transporter ATP-binding protein/permease [Acuticoccus mangrovi]|uniref:ATP-binding cassette domain-containing protein n=1 Tax=Acuticoccus mangrovi TaxID=2796142 RepID=A0A934IS62_9HYPH|nr:branched-chain amino acid ABC transporter ATP-binding protein/permease [Acuticoccus mangrovi]MBJ3777786.1 ATP-binding cassette domain-containing protein [Acuticoccus mangrovi]